MRSLPIYYRPEMAHVPVSGTSMSPAKPRLFHDAMAAAHPVRALHFERADPADLLVAHTPEYVRGMMDGDDRHTIGTGVPWSPGYVDAALHCVGAMREAVRGAVERQHQFAVCPVAGFHHAAPDHGRGFCAFSGQVVAAVAEHRRSGAVGCWVDLDHHDGDSIELTRPHCPELVTALPPSMNVNPKGRDAAYIRSLRRKLAAAGTPDYVVHCHGADSCRGDDLGGRISEQGWFECTDVVAEWAYKANAPVVMTLFGGYREGRYHEVIDLHVRDAARMHAYLS